MLRGDPWSEEEVAAIVADYFAMLEKELRGIPYSKTAHRRALLPRLRNRSEGSVERKHQNISAVLDAAHLPYIDGSPAKRGTHWVRVARRWSSRTSAPVSALSGATASRSA